MVCSLIGLLGQRAGSKHLIEAMLFTLANIIFVLGNLIPRGISNNRILFLHFQLDYLWWPPTCVAECVGVDVCVRCLSMTVQWLCDVCFVCGL